MENTRLGKFEAIAFIVTVMINHVFMNMTKTIITSTQSGAILNTIYISLMAIIISYIIYLLLNKFPTFDILDISNFLGGKILKTIISILFLSYFIFFTANLLKNFSYLLQIIYYTSTNTFFIIIVFLIATIFVCNLKNNAIFRSNLLIVPLVIISTIILFLGNTGDFDFENAFPVLGNGINETFILGVGNLFAFQGLLHILLLPPRLKDVTKLKKITILSIVFSAFYLIVNILIILFLFDVEVTNSLLSPLYSAARYIEFGSFFQRLDSIFMLVWIISFVSYLSIIVSTCSTILKKATPIKSNKFTTILVSLSLLFVTFFSKNYAVSTFFTDAVYKYSFFVILGLSLIILTLAFLVKTNKNKSNSLNGGVQ